MKPAAGEPAQTVRITVSANDAPGLRQFLNRRAEAPSNGEAETADPQTSVAPKAGETTPNWVAGALFAADAVVVLLSTVLLAQGQTVLLQAIGCAGIVAGATLGVLGVVLWDRSR